MIAGFASQVRVFLYRHATDLRKSFNGLVALTESKIQQDPLSGSYFVFVNRRQDRIKILYWGQTGYCIWYQHLQRGTSNSRQTVHTDQELQPSSDRSVRVPARCLYASSDDVRS